MSRPGRLNDLTAQRIVNAVKAGLPRSHAARAARIHPSTLFDWLAKGRAGDVGYAEFSERVAEAEAHDVEELVGTMREHAKVSWQACAWLLERRYPKQFAARKQEAPGVAVTPEEAAKLVAECAALAK